MPADSQELANIENGADCPPQPRPRLLGAAQAEDESLRDELASLVAHSCDSDKAIEFHRVTSSPLSAESGRSKDSDAEAKGPKHCGLSLKWISLAALTLQTSGQAILIKWSRSLDGGETKYLNSTAVFFIEVVKATVSLALVVWECGGIKPAVQNLRAHFTQSPVDLLKAAVPSLIYTIQNNLMFYSFDKLSAPVQQVLYQMKIITTAGLGVLMLGKPLTPTKWAACFMLAVGVSLVQWPRDGMAAVDAACQGAMCPLSGEQVKGFLAVLCACFTSGFAGVWIQKMLQQTTASVWVRNVQLALFGSCMSAMVAFAQDGQRILDSGLTQGYNGRVLSVILMTALGGLLCAVMLKYAGATHGCFSTAMSLVLTSLLSRTLLGDFAPDSVFVLGTCVAIGASLLFALGLPNCAPDLLAPVATLDPAARHASGKHVK